MKNWRNWLKIAAQAIAFILATFGLQQASDHFIPDEPIVLQSAQPVFDTIYTDGLLHIDEIDTTQSDPVSVLLYEAFVEDVIDGGGRPDYKYYRPEVRTARVYKKHENSLEFLKGKDNQAHRIITVLKRY